MKFKKLGMGILCAVMACGILAGCGGGGDDPMTAMVKSSGQAVKYGDKEAKVLALETRVFQVKCGAAPGIEVLG